MFNLIYIFVLMNCANILLIKNKENSSSHIKELNNPKSIQNCKLLFDFFIKRIDIMNEA